MTPDQKERLRWVLEHRAEGNLSKLDSMAGLARGHVGAMLRPGDQRDPQVGVIEKIAKATGVSAAWLAYGHGTPDDKTNLPPDLLTAIEVGSRWSPWTIAAVARLAVEAKQDHSPQEWAAVLDRWESVHKPLAAPFVQRHDSSARLKT